MHLGENHIEIFQYDPSNKSNCTKTFVGDTPEG